MRSQKMKSVGMALVVMASLLALPALAAGQGEEVVRLRVQAEKESVVVEIPMAVLEFFQKHQVTNKLDAGEINGQKITLSLDKLLKGLKDSQGKTGESLLFSAEEAGKKTTFFASVAKGSPRDGKAPTSVSLLVKDLKAGAEKVRITVPLSAVDAVLQAITVEGSGKGDDVGTLFKSGIPFLQEIGTGLLAHLVSDTEEVTLRLE